LSGWFPVVVGLATYPYWYWYGRDANFSTSKTFFDVSAQVLPVLILAAIVSVGATKRLASSQIVFPLIAVVIGEVGALSVSAGTDPADRTNFAIVAASFIVAVTAVILIALADAAPLIDPGIQSKASRVSPNRAPATETPTPAIGDVVTATPDGEAKRSIRRSVAGSEVEPTGTQVGYEEVALISAGLAAFIALAVGPGAWTLLTAILGITLIIVIVGYYRPRLQPDWHQTLFRRLLPVAAVSGLAICLIVSYPLQQNAMLDTPNCAHISNLVDKATCIASETSQWFWEFWIGTVLLICVAGMFRWWWIFNKRESESGRDNASANAEINGEASQ
jgi:hypothetical protein